MSETPEIEAASSHQLPARTAESPEASATQLTILLSAATSILDEEFKRSERLDAKSRNQLSVAAAFFTVVQAVAVALINGTLKGSAGHPRSSFVTWIALVAALSSLALVAAVFVSYQSWKLRDDKALGPNTLRTYLEPARQGNPGVGVKLVQGYADIAEDRRSNNKKRAQALDQAAIACGWAFACLGAELIVAFISVAVR
jgi:hypothetical protein